MYPDLETAKKIASQEDYFEELSPFAPIRRLRKISNIRENCSARFLQKTKVRESKDSHPLQGDLQDIFLIAGARVEDLETSYHKAEFELKQMADLVMNGKEAEFVPVPEFIAETNA